MNEDFAKSAASPNTIRLAGREYLVGKLTPRDVGDLQAWLKEQIPNPKDEARRLMGGLPDVVALEIWREAVSEAKNWPPSIGDPRGFGLLSTTLEGNTRIVWVALRKHNPGITLDIAREITETLEMSDLEALIALISPESSRGPKAETATNPTAD